MDDQGESYAGFWRSDDPDTRANASQLSFDHNTLKLWELPFHTAFLSKTVAIGCSYREECVKYSNFLGYWVQQKTQQLKQAVLETIQAEKLTELVDIEFIIADYLHS